MGNAASRKLLFLIGPGSCQSIHYEEAAGDAEFRELPVHKDPGPITDGRSAHAAMKEAAERTEALEPNLETDIGYRKLAVCKHLLGLRNASFCQVLMRRRIERLPEESQEVIARQTGFPSNLIEIEREMVAVIH